MVAGDSAGEIWHWFSAISSKRREGSSQDGLMSPWTDMTASGRSYTQRAEMDPTITMDYIQAVREGYAGKGSDLAHALASVWKF